MAELQMEISPGPIFFEVCYVHSEDTIPAFQGLEFMEQVSTEYVKYFRSLLHLGLQSKTYTVI